MSAFEYSKWDPSQEFIPQSADKIFDKLNEYFLEHGDEARVLFDQIEESHPDIIEKLLRRGLIERDSDGKYRVTPKGIRRAENRALQELFQVTRKDGTGRHDTDMRGLGQTVHTESRPYSYGDSTALLNFPETMRNAVQRNRGELPIRISEEDLVVHDTEYQSHCATVVLVDMSGSMSRYGKFRQAKQVALSLHALVRNQYPGDWLRVVGFSTFAEPLSEHDLYHATPKVVSLYDSRVHLRIPLDQPSGFVPEHFTNIHLGLQYARRLLRRQPAANKQIITITDGEPTAHIEGRDLLLVYPPSEKTARITLAEVQRCARDGIHMSSFALIEDYFYLGLVNFVERMAAVSQGIAAYCDAEGLGKMVVENFSKGRKRRSVK